jgi:hypothetical protein
VVLSSTLPDSDGDGIPDSIDDCPAQADAAQTGTCPIADAAVADTTAPPDLTAMPDLLTPDLLPPPATGYSFSIPTGISTDRTKYPDEMHNLFTSGSLTDGSLFETDAPGQLLDGKRGTDSYTADLGNGSSYEWVGFASTPEITFRFSGFRAFTSVAVGTLVATGPAIYEAAEIHVSFSIDGNVFAGEQVFKVADGTLPVVPDGKRADLSLSLAAAQGNYVRLSFVTSGWLFLDEIAFN